MRKIMQIKLQSNLFRKEADPNKMKFLHIYLFIIFDWMSYTKA